MSFSFSEVVGNQAKIEQLFAAQIEKLQERQAAHSSPETQIEASTRATALAKAAEVSKGRE